MTNNAKLLLEPAIGTYANNITKYFFATRPAFLLAALAACLLGLASAKLGGVNLNNGFCSGDNTAGVSCACRSERP
ncbi:MAG: hypothetical protein V9G21_04180 [Methylotenera sp.]